MEVDIMSINQALGENSLSLALPQLAGSDVFQPGQTVNTLFRYECHYESSSRTGEPAWTIDLYQRKAIITGRALACDIPDFPPADTLIRIEGVIIRTGDIPMIWIRRLEPVAVLGADFCIFDTALPNWITDEHVVDRARNLWASLPAEDRQFVNAVFHESRVLHGFLAVPGSCRHHHAHDGGCIEHSVQAAELASSLAVQSLQLDRDLLVTAALIHDSGKALEYVRCKSGRWRMSRYGRRVGHKVGGIQLATIAMTKCPGMRPERKESLLHVLSSSYAPSWAGFRPPASREAALMAAIDRVSAEAGQSGRV
jgi:hypothetical protein